MAGTKREHLTFDEVRDMFIKFNKDNGYTTKGTEKKLEARVVFTKESFTLPYSVKERTYMFTSDNKAFIEGQSSASIFGDCMDGTDNGVRLDWYMQDGKPQWIPEYCYLVGKKVDK